MENLNKLPKVELHLHLDGSLNPKLAYQLALKDGIITQNLEFDEFIKDMVAPAKINHLWEFLKCFDLPIALMQTKENLKLIINDLFDQLIKDNVVYAEIRYAPGQHLLKGLSLEEIISVISEQVCAFNERNLGTHVEIIHCLMIDPTLKNDDINWEVIKLTEKYLGKGVVGVDLAGPECAVNMEYYAPFFAYAKSLNIPFTIHAGEVGPASNVEKAIEFGALRIGHGGNCILDENVVQLVKDKDVLLEVCLSSNIQCKNQQSYETHPLKQLLKNNIKCCINTDNRTLTNITLADEYVHCIQSLDLTMDDIKQMNLNAINACFASEEVKENVRKILLNRK